MSNIFSSLNFCRSLELIIWALCFTPWTKQNKTALKSLWNQLGHITMVMRQRNGASTCLCPICIECVARKIHIHDAKGSPLTALRGFTKRLRGYVSVAGRFWRREDFFFGVSHSIGLEGEMQQEKVTQCFLSLFFSPSPSVLSIFNVYRFYLAGHSQQPLWHCR